ncbi:MAG: hypothetical protein Q8K94_02280, partial [Moraxellaceae bacterium]|nr:hypothetical protein [Moraxellaceae bacterium]
MHTPMAEAQRRQYLQALGMPQFVAKQDLAIGAASSYTFAEVAEQVELSPELPAAVAAPVQRMPVSLPELLPTPAKPATSEPAPQRVQPPKVEPSTTVSFSCRLFLLGIDRIALLATQKNQDLSAAELSLWRSLCAAMNWPMEDGNARFDWPFAYAKHLASDPAAAKDALTAWWQAHCELPSQVFVLGNDLTDFAPANATVLPSLAEMMASPMLKKTTWQRLQK